MQNNFKKFKKTPLIFSVAFLLLVLFVFVFVYKNTQDNNKIFKESQERWQIENSKKDEMIFIDHTLKTIEKERILLNSHFIQSSDVVPFLDTIEKLALKVGAVAQIDLVDIPANNPELIVGLRIIGSFEAIYKFLTLLENSSYQLEIISMNMQKNETAELLKNQVPEWSAIFKIKLLSFIK